MCPFDIHTYTRPPIAFHVRILALNFSFSFALVNNNGTNNVYNHIYISNIFENLDALAVVAQRRKTATLYILL